MIFEQIFVQNANFPGSICPPSFDRFYSAFLQYAFENIPF
jgi:hypothetical protein